MTRFSRIRRRRQSRVIVPRQHAAARHRAHAADVEGPLHQGAAQFLFAFFRPEHPFQGGAEVLGHLVDDVVAADLHAAALGQDAGGLVGDHVEADDHGVGGVGQVDVGLGDAAHGGLEDLDLHLGVLQLAQLLADGLDRAADVGPQDDVQRLHLVLLAQPLEEGFQGDVGAAAAEFSLAVGRRPRLGQLAGRPRCPPGRRSGRRRRGPRSGRSR